MVKRILIKRGEEEKYIDLNPIIKDKELVKIFCSDGSFKFKKGIGKPYLETPFLENNMLSLDDDVILYLDDIPFFNLMFSIQKNE